MAIINVRLLLHLDFDTLKLQTPVELRGIIYRDDVWVCMCLLVDECVCAYQRRYLWPLAC